ncbi:MAG: hypothetical protein V8S27_03405 [Lachnospiraceae bacterium]
MDLSEIKVGDTIYAYIGPAMTMSLPLQTNAEFIVCRFLLMQRHRSM